MKEAEFTIEFITHCLALSSGPKQDSCERFDRDSQNRIIWKQTWWYTAFGRTIEMYNIRGVKPNDFNVSLLVDTPTEVYKRKYGQNGFRRHEAIMPGTQVTFKAVVSDNVTESTFKHLLEKMGDYVGVSPYGHNLGYGKFVVNDVTLTPVDQK
jgi:hypothetical protein